VGATSPLPYPVTWKFYVCSKYLVTSNSVPNFSIISLWIMQLCEYVFCIGYANLKLNFFLLDLNNNYVKYRTALSLQPTPLASLVLHITPILKSLHWLRVNERINYKLLSLTYKVLTTAQPSNLHKLISLQPPHSTRSSSVVTLSPANHLLLENHRSLI